MLQLTTGSTNAGPPRLNRKDIVEAINRRDRYNTGGGAKSIGDDPSKSFASNGSPDLGGANTALSSAVDADGNTPHPLINIQTAQS